jgi:hypothetical protein
MSRCLAAEIGILDDEEDDECPIIGAAVGAVTAGS